MDILYNVDEKYLQAIEELNYGELPKALHLFNDIINSDPTYGRAYYQLGICYYYNFKDYQSAGYYLKKCIELEPEFPDAYTAYLRLLVTLKMHKAIQSTAEKALAIPGVCETCVYELLGNHAEQNQDLAAAKQYYEKATLTITNVNDHSDLQDSIKRIATKQATAKKLVYVYQD